MKNSLFILLLIVVACIMQTEVSAQDTKKYYIDVHKLGPGSVSYADVAAAHAKDLHEQENHGVSFITYWVDTKGGNVYCLSSADDPAHVKMTHEHAHGLVPQEIYEVIAGQAANYTGNGTLYLDIHELGPGNVTAAAVEEAHQKDLHEEGKHNVHFINYWVSETTGKIFCLSEAPDENAVIETHKHAHGLTPVTVIEVKQGQ